MPPAPIPSTPPPPAFVPADVLHHLNVVKTNSPNLTLEDTIDSIWLVINYCIDSCITVGMNLVITEVNIVP